MSQSDRESFDERPLSGSRSLMMKQRLVRTTVKLLASEGYHGATIQKICGEAGVSNGALFRHYATREQLMGEVALELGRLVAEAFAAVRTIPLTDAPALHPLTGMMRHVRDITRSELGAAWREVLTASRHSALMEEALRTPIHNVKVTAMHHVSDVTGIAMDHPMCREAMVAIITVLHAFNGEALSGPLAAVDSNAEVRLQLLARFLGDALVRASEAAMSG